MSKTTVSHGSNVSLKLEVLDEEGDVIETSDPDEPLEIIVGDGDLPPTVEKGLVGATIGQELEIDCPAGEAFGEPDLEAIVTVPRGDFPEDLELEVGLFLTVGIEDDDGTEGEMEATIVEVNDEAVILDANHPLAGKPATFRVTIVSIR